MKNFKYISILIFLLIFSCSQDDKTIDLVSENVERGAVLRTLNSTNTYNFYDTEDSRFAFDLTVEAQGEGNGAIPSTIRIYQSFKDNTEDDVDNNKAEVLINTIDVSTLEIGDNGFPVYTMPTLALQDALDINSVADGEYFGLDQFVYRLELETEDGRIFTTPVGGNVASGSFYRSPYTYSVTIKCIPIVPFPGQYTISIADEFSDSWENAFVTATVDGIDTTYTTDAGAQTFMLDVPDGTSDLSFTYTPGFCCANEHTIKISYDPDPLVMGDEIEAASAGPSPSDGEIFLNICQ